MIDDKRWEPYKENWVGFTNGLMPRQKWQVPWFKFNYLCMLFHICVCFSVILHIDSHAIYWLHFCICVSVETACTSVCVGVRVSFLSLCSVSGCSRELGVPLESLNWRGCVEMCVEEHSCLGLLSISNTRTPPPPLSLFPSFFLSCSLTHSIDPSWSLLYSIEKMPLHCSLSFPACSFSYLMCLFPLFTLCFVVVRTSKDYL